MSKVTSVKIDVTKIDKNRLFKGKKGTYLDAVIVWNDTPDQYGNDGFIAESVSKEEREAGKQGAILGNVKNMGGRSEKISEDSGNSRKPIDNNDMPF